MHILPKNNRYHVPGIILLLPLLCISLLSGGCATLITKNFIEPAVGNLQQQTDIHLVCDGAPAYLLMLDSMLVSSPDNRALLLSAAQSYSAFTATLEECGENKEQRFTAIALKAKQYGQRLLAMHLPLKGSIEEFEQEIATLTKTDVPELFWGTYGWLTWVQNQQGSPEAIADIVYIEKIMTKLLELDPGYQGGSIHLFWGVYHAAKPAMFGGRPDLSKAHFEKALEYSDKKFLMAQTTYAETYARAVFDKDLHDRLLKEVLDFPLESAPEFGLSNRIAVSKAKKLLDENYFGD
jgi:hypothetical protein